MAKKQTNRARAVAKNDASAQIDSNGALAPETEHSDESNQIDLNDPTLTSEEAVTAQLNQD